MSLCSRLGFLRWYAGTEYHENMDEHEPPEHSLLLLNKINKHSHAETKLLEQPYSVIYNFPSEADEEENELQHKQVCAVTVHINWKHFALALMGVL